MDLALEIERLFYDDFLKEYNLKKGILFDILKENKTCKIKIKSLGLDEIINRSNDSTFLNDELIKIEEDTITLIYPFEKEMKELLSHVNSNVEELHFPCDILDFNDIGKFKELKKLIDTNNHKFSKDELDLIVEKSNIGEISTNLFSFNVDEYSDEDFVFVKFPIYVGEYKNLKLRNVNSYEFDARIIEVYVGKKGFHKITKIMDECNLLDYDNLYISSFKNGDYRFENGGFKAERDKDDNYNIVFADMDIKGVNSIFDYYNNKGVDVSSVTLKCDNRDYDDIFLLKNIDSKTDFKINYNSLDSASLADFIAMRKTIDWYKELIEQANLSPLEKAMYAYDILKTFKYNEDDNKSNSRYIHNILSTGSIVCVGYSKFYEQLLNELGINAISVSVDCFNEDGSFRGGHERNIVDIDDDKYDVHGIFVCDATWDSRKEKFEALDLYQRFMVPPRDYETNFKNDSVPKLLKKDTGLLVYVKDDLKKLYGNEKYSSEIVDRINSTRINLNIINKVMEKVRIAEGYSENNINDEVKRTIELNKMIAEATDRDFFNSKKK